MSDWLLDQINHDVSDPRFLTALLNVRMDSESTELQQRFQKMVNPFLSLLKVKEQVEPRRAKTKEAGKIKGQRIGRPRPSL